MGASREGWALAASASPGSGDESIFDSIRDAKDKVEDALEDAIDAVTSLGTGTAHGPAPGPSNANLKIVSDRNANAVARNHGYDDAHDAKKGRGGSRVNIYYDKGGTGFYLWDGRSPEREPL